jgi:hypothetical protein
MSLVFDPGVFPAFTFTKDLLLILGLTFMAMGITQMIYCLIRIRQPEGEGKHIED